MVDRIRRRAALLVGNYPSCTRLVGCNARIIYSSSRYLAVYGKRKKKPKPERRATHQGARKSKKRQKHRTLTNGNRRGSYRNNHDVIIIVWVPIISKYITYIILSRKARIAHSRRYTCAYIVITMTYERGDPTLGIYALCIGMIELFFAGTVMCVSVCTNNNII